MQITETDFGHYVPSSQCPEGYGVFPLLEDHIDVATKEVRALLGEAAWAECHTPAAEEGTAECVRRYICLSAYHRAIPGLDLVLTPTGFGVVSNQNVAPASKERVDRLRSEVKYSRDLAHDALLEALRHMESWNDTPQAHEALSSLVWSSEHADALGYPGEGCSRLEELRPQIALAEFELTQTISKAFHDELLTAFRKGEETPEQKAVMNRCLAYIYSAAGKRGSDAAKEASRQNLVRLLDAMAPSFPTYRASSAYAALHFEHYQNKKDDSCFFF